MDTGCYRDLDVWKKAMELAVASYELAALLPPHERYALAIQIRRTAASVAANIAEGNGRSTRGAYVQFLRVARGSLVELETHVELAQRVGYLTTDRCALTRRLPDQVGRMLTMLLRSLTS